MYQEWPKFHIRNMRKFFIGSTCTTYALIVFFYVYFRLSLRRIGLSTSPLHLSFSLATLVASVRGPVFPFRWFFFGFLLDGLSNFTHHGVHERAIFVCLVLSILNIYPNHFLLLRLITILFSSSELKTQVSLFYHLSWFKKKSKNPLLQNHRANFNQTWYKTSLGKRDLNFFFK